MHGLVSRFAKLCVPDCEDTLIEIDTSQVAGFRETQASGCDQSEERLVGRRSQSTVRRKAAMRATKDYSLRELGRRIEPRQIPREWTKDLQTTGPGKGLAFLA